MTDCPDLKTSIILWQQSISAMAAWGSAQCLREYIYHTTGVAESACKIASKCGLNEEKAYIFGLLHDYGKKQNQQITGISHIMSGYDEMMSLGWSDVARICLTHSFPDPDFNFNDYPSYPEKDLIRAKELISCLQYNDYDKLIQLCDGFFEGVHKISYQRRIAGIRERYNLTAEQTAVLENKAVENKAYFDAKCGCDIYLLLGIEE